MELDTVTHTQYGLVAPRGQHARLDWGVRAQARRAERRTTALGWLSLGLGVAGLAAPKYVARWLGLPKGQRTERVLRAVGVREIVCGIGLLARGEPSSWTWARVAGDIVDIALLGRNIAGNAKAPQRALAATAAIVGVALLDTKTAVELSQDNRAGLARNWQGFLANATITTNRAPEEVYRYWRDFANFPYFMQHLSEVRVLENDRLSHWRAKGPLGMNVEWTAEIVRDEPNELISWRSVADSQVPNRGTVRFVPAPGGLGTEIHVAIEYAPPAGKLGNTVAKLFASDPEQQIADDLRRFKQVLEIGEVLRSDASIHRGLHPARPSGSTFSSSEKLSPQPTRVIS